MVYQNILRSIFLPISITSSDTSSSASSQIYSRLCGRHTGFFCWAFFLPSPLLNYKKVEPPADHIKNLVTKKQVRNNNAVTFAMGVAGF